MRIQCPRCQQAVPADKVNMLTDLGICPACDQMFRVSETLDLDVADEDALRNPPSGAWFVEEIQGFTVGATTRSPAALFLVPFMCVWSGGSLGGIYLTQIISGKFNLMLSLFGIPFVLGSILFWSIAMMTLCGKVVVTSQGAEGGVFVGVGSIGWRRKFTWSAVKHIREEGGGGHPGGSGGSILLEGEERLRFGSGLNDRRRYFMLNAVKYMKAMAR